MRALLLLALVAPLALAQKSPYAGEESRGIKALSSGEVEGYLKGRGMGLAKPAELNGYPGPMHVLELQDELRLTPEQVKRTEARFVAMRAKATRLGKQIVAAERTLDRLFADGRITRATLRKQTAQIATLQGDLRLAHLEAHLDMMPILTKTQIRRYSELRGYGE